MTESDDYRWYREALAGRNPPIHEGEPQCGFFMRRTYGGRPQAQTAGPILPAAIWHDGGGDLVASEGFANTFKAVNPVDLWSWVANHPISSEVYWQAYEAGSWPNDMAPEDKRFGPDGVPLPGDNKPPVEEGSAEDISERIDAAIGVIRATLTDADGKLAVADQDAADKAANARDRLRSLADEAENARKAEKKPFDDSAKAVQQKWLPIKEKADTAAQLLGNALTAFLTAEQRRKDELAKAAREAAEAAVQAGTPIEEVAADLAAAKPQKVRAGGAISGRRASLRTVKSAKITDYAKLLAAVAEQPEVKEAVTAVANRSARANITLPGMEIVTGQKA